VALHEVVSFLRAQNAQFVDYCRPWCRMRGHADVFCCLKARRAALGLCFIAVSLLFAPGALAASPLQAALDRMMAGEPAAAVVVSARDGRVLAAYNRRLLARRVATPGSAIKPFVLELLLEKGAVRPDESIACTRKLTIAGKRLDCSHAPELGSFTAEEALAFSCNSYFAVAAARLTPGDLERRFRELGLVRPTGLLGDDEAEGRLRDAHRREERQLLALGAAGIEITPLELAAAYLRLARLDPSRASVAQKTVLAGLRDAVDFGLAQNAQPLPEQEGTASAGQFRVAGKTGTASDQYDARTHAWFAGFAPAESPAVVVVVFVERGRGGVEAASLAQKVFAEYAKERSRQ
jgi:penicillin-binding protein 2